MGALFGLFAREAQAQDARARAQLAEARVFLRAGDSAAALEHLEEVIAAHASDLEAFELAVPLWFENGQLQRAQTALEELSLRCPACPFAWYALGATYRKRGRFDLAILAYEELLRLRPDDADGLYGYAMSLVAKRDSRAASVLARYLERESRPARGAFRSRARRLLVQLAGSAEPRPRWRDKFDALLRDGRILSAEAVLDGLEGSEAVLGARREIAERRGRPLSILGYDVVLLGKSPLALERLARIWRDLCSLL